MTGTDALRAARSHDSETKRRRARAALDELIGLGAVVNFETVRRRAGVSRSMLYADTELKARIINQRQAQPETTPAPKRSAVSDASLRNDLALAEDDNRALRHELESLRRRLGMTVAAELDATVGAINPTTVASLQEHVAELHDKLHDANQRVLALETDNTELIETLDASRENYRRLMAETNRSTASRDRETTR